MNEIKANEMNTISKLNIIKSNQIAWNGVT